MTRSSDFVFGAPLRAARSSRPASWLADAVSGAFGSVGGLVPGHYERYVLMESAPATADDWWAAQRDIVVALAEVLRGFTDTPDDAWFAIWEGHSSEWAAVDALRALPRLDRPHRSYFLVNGAVDDVAHIVEPVPPHGWFRPDLWWPQDRSWFVGTDVDFWCNYVGGSQAMIDAVMHRLPGRCHPAFLDDALRVED